MHTVWPAFILTLALTLAIGVGVSAWNWITGGETNE